MSSRIISVFTSLVSIATLAVMAGCSAPASDASASADGTQQGDEQDVTSAPSATKLPSSQVLKNASFQSLRTLYANTTYDYQTISDTSAFSFGQAPAMTDAQALGLAKSIAKTAGYGEVHQFVLNAAGTSKTLGHLANTLSTDVCASGDDKNTPKLVAAMIKAFALPGKTPGGSIKVFSAIGPGDDHDGDNVDREVIFVDTTDGEALVLQGQALDR
jgi:hypothetical protein